MSASLFVNCDQDYWPKAKIFPTSISCPCILVGHEEVNALSHCHNEWQAITSYLPSLFKGVANCHLDKIKLSAFPDMSFYAMQKKAWMDKSTKSVWIGTCLLPWKDMLPPDTSPHLGLSSCPHDGNSSWKIQGIGIKSKHSWRLHLLVPTNRCGSK